VAGRAVQEGRVQVSMFFFEKKNQKTFFRLLPCRSGETGANGESLFASFSSEKEDFLSWSTAL
jgi:hypothetical protein